MTVYSIWESRFPPEASAEGRAVTERIWQDMQACEDYVGHELLRDLDDPGHLLVVSRWESRATPIRCSPSTPAIRTRSRPIAWWPVRGDDSSPSS